MRSLPPLLATDGSVDVVVASTQIWWYVARSSGVVAWALSAASVLWGLALSTRALGAKPKAPWLLDVHRFVGGLTIVFVAVHMAALAFDPFVSFDLPSLLVPMVSDWKPGAVAWGVVAFYLLLAVELTSLIRRRLPTRVWKSVHLTAYAMYALATVHLLTAGTDRTNPLLLGAAWVSIGAVAFFTLYRVVGPGRAASVRAGKAPGPRRNRHASPSGSPVPEGSAPSVTGPRSGDSAVSVGPVRPS